MPTPMTLTPPRWRALTLLGTGVALTLLLGSSGLLSPGAGAAEARELRAIVLEDRDRLERAVRDFTADTGAFPTAVFDLSEGYDGGLSDPLYVPRTVAAAWAGPYLRPRLARPTRASFWSLAEPCSMQDEDGDGQPDELWGRLHRGYGEVDDALANWLDATLDDGRPEQGLVRVTPTWIWFKLLES